MADENRNDPRAWLRMLVRLDAEVGVRLVANALVGYAVPSMTCRPSYATVAAIVGFHEKVVMGHVRVLREAGALIVHKRLGPRGQQRPNEFELTWPADEEAARRCLGAKRSKRREGRTGTTPAETDRYDPPPSDRYDAGGETGTTPEGRTGVPEGSYRYDPILKQGSQEGSSSRSQGAAAAAPPLSGPDEDNDVARAIEVRLTETRAAGKPPRDDLAWRHALRVKFEANPAEVKAILARDAARAAAPAAPLESHDDRRRREQEDADARRDARLRAIAAYDQGTLPPELVADWTKRGEAAADRAGVRLHRERFVREQVLDLATEWALSGALVAAADEAA